jgi:hypothetical protein
MRKSLSLPQATVRGEFWKGGNGSVFGEHVYQLFMGSTFSANLAAECVKGLNVRRFADKH